jgi:hypothetical protein
MIYLFIDGLFWLLMFVCTGITYRVTKSKIAACSFLVLSLTFNLSGIIIFATLMSIVIRIFIVFDMLFPGVELPLYVQPQRVQPPYQPPPPQTFT